MGIARVLLGIVFCDGNFMVICWELMGISWDFTVSIAGIKRHIKHNQSSTVYLFLPMTDPCIYGIYDNMTGVD